MAAIIRAQFQNWVAQHTQIQFAHPVKGGWERWAQVDFNNFLRSTWFAVMTELEDYVYTNGGRDDLTVGPVGVAAGMFPGGVMELKVLNQGETLAHFITKLNDDVATLGTPLKPNYAGYTKCAFALANAQQMLLLLQTANNNPGINFTNYAPFLNNAINTHTAVLIPSAKGEQYFFFHRVW